MDSITSRLIFSLAMALSTFAGCTEDSEFTPGKPDDRADVSLEQACPFAPYQYNKLTSSNLSVSQDFCCTNKDGCLLEVKITLAYEDENEQYNLSGELLKVQVNDQEEVSLWAPLLGGIDMAPPHSPRVWTSNGSDLAGGSVFLETQEGTHTIKYRLPAGLDDFEFEFFSEPVGYLLAIDCPPTPYPAPYPAP